MFLKDWRKRPLYRPMLSKIGIAYNFEKEINHKKTQYFDFIEICRNLIHQELTRVKKLKHRI